MQTKTINGVEYGFVELPNHTSILLNENILSAMRFGECDWWIKLPTGTWRIIGIAAELKEQEWKTLVERSDNLFECYRDYENFHSYEHASALASGSSLIASFSMQPETTLILRKQK